MAGALAAGGRDAAGISANIQARHLPYGRVLDPVLSASGEVTSKVTKPPEALGNVARAMEGICLLRDVMGRGLLARCAFPVDSPFAADLIGEESAHGVRTGKAAGQT